MSAVVDRDGLDDLLAALARRGYTVIGPTVRSGSIVYDELGSAADLPAGWIDVQDAGSFRLERDGSEALFAHAVGHDSLKRWLFPPAVPVWHARRGLGRRAHLQRPVVAAPRVPHRHGRRE